MSLCMTVLLTSGSPRLFLNTLFRFSSVFHLEVVHSMTLVWARRLTFSLAKVHCNAEGGVRLDIKHQCSTRYVMATFNDDDEEAV